MRAILFVAILMLALALAVQGVSAKTLGQAGTTYQIVERDAIEEFQEAASKVDWQKIFSDGFERAKSSFGAAPQSVWLPRAEENKTRMLTPAYTLPFDVPNPANVNEVLYPAGYTYNPLAFVSMKEDLVFVDITDKRQAAWVVAEYGKKGKQSAIVMLTGGDMETAIRLLDRPVYVATPEMVDSFQLTRVPTVMTQSGTQYVVNEIVPPESFAKTTKKVR